MNNKKNLLMLSILLTTCASCNQPSEEVSEDPETEFVIKDELKTLPCFHIYHKNCINEWLRNNMNCVICKTEIGNGNNNGNSSSNGNGMVGSTYQSGLYQMIIGDDDAEEELSMPFPSGD